MNIYMPLHEFHSSESLGFRFEGTPYSITRFESSMIPDIDLFSRQDKFHMEMEHLALCADNPDLTKYREEINLLLLCFKIHNHAKAWIKFRVCREDIDECRVLNETYNPANPDLAPVWLTNQDLLSISQLFGRLIKMRAVSNRTKNAIYFLYCAHTSQRWMEGFSLTMSALEALFSGEGRTAMTKTICSRTAGYLFGKLQTSYSEVLGLYDLRSEIPHGKISLEMDLRPTENVEKLYRIQEITNAIFKDMLITQYYEKYADVVVKEADLNILAALAPAPTA